MRTDLSSIKEADSSVNGVVAYFILLSGAALQHPPPAKRRCNLSGEINIKCMCKAMTSEMPRGIPSKAGDDVILGVR